MCDLYLHLYWGPPSQDCFFTFVFDQQREQDVSTAVLRLPDQNVLLTVEPPAERVVANYPTKRNRTGAKLLDENDNNLVLVAESQIYCRCDEGGTVVGVLFPIVLSVVSTSSSY